APRRSRGRFRERALGRERLLPRRPLRASVRPPARALREPDRLSALGRAVVVADGLRDPQPRRRRGRLDAPDRRPLALAGLPGAARLARLVVLPLRLLVRVLQAARARLLGPRMTDAVVFEHVSKHFRGGHAYRALRDDIVGALGRVVGIKRGPQQVVRALDDVSLEIPEGQSFALLGPNGAGKTTALKLASRISYPTSGRIRVRGRVGALIEVGTGMHPELTGRENVDLYGRILGLSRRDIRRRFDEIVEFADVGGALEQPVKQFSSGMQLRLGFALAAHLEPDVLLVDEAIAGGDG